MKNFNNKIIYITGGSSGIGLATAKEFIKYGASVLLISRNVTKLEAARDLNVYSAYSKLVERWQKDSQIWGLIRDLQQHLLFLLL